MRVLQINAVYEYSSTGRTTRELHKFLSDKGVDSYVGATNVDGKDDHIIKIGGSISNKLHGFFSHVFGKQGFYSYFSTLKFLRRVSEIKPDIVHLRVLHSSFINIPLLLKYLAKNNIPVVITLHDCWFFTGHCCYFSDSNCDKWQRSCGSCPDIHNWNASWFFDNSKKNLLAKKNLFQQIEKLAVIGVSDWVTNFVHHSILSNSFIIKRIYNWIDIDVFKPLDSNKRRMKLGLNENFVVLCLAQNWGEQKGINDIFDIAELRPNYKFVLVGGLTDKYKPLPQNVLSVGVTANVQELVEYYSMADVFFNPSRRETFGKVTVESLSCGTPVVAYNLTATPELVKEGCGFIADFHDYEQVLMALDHIAKEGKSSYASRCRKFVVSEFSSNKLMTDYYNLYKSLI